MQLIMTFALLGIFTILFYTRTLKLPFMTLITSLVWKLRAVFHIHPLPRQLEGWARTPSADQSIFDEETIKCYSFWIFMEQFFELKGYILFKPIQHGPFINDLVPSTIHAPDPGKRRSDYPYSRKSYEMDKETRFASMSTQVWPARDADGNDLIIRLISAGKDSDELRIWQRLHSPQLKDHPRNRAIPVLEYIQFDGLIFVVMPRWDTPVFNDFATAEEVLHYAECVLDFVDFLHEHRIVHRDLDGQNIGINNVNSIDMEYPKGNCDPTQVHYGIIDFGFSLIYPHDSELNEAATTARYGWENEDSPWPRNPYQLEAHYVVSMLQTHVRVIEKFIPEIGPFFDGILNAEEKDRPFAREVLERFRLFQSSLTVEQLKTPLRYRTWRKGRFERK